jgi:hypothetical protein
MYRQTNQVNTGSPGVIGFDSNLLLASAVRVGLRIDPHTTTITSVVGSLNGAYELLFEDFDATTSRRVAIYGFNNSAAGAETITATLSGNDSLRMIAAEFTDRAPTSAGDLINDSGFVLATPVNSGNVVTPAAGYDLFGFLSLNAFAVTFTASGTLAEITETDGDRVGAAAASNQAAGTYAFTGTLSEDDTHIAIVQALAPPAGAAQAIHVPRGNPQRNRRHSGRYMRLASGLLVPVPGLLAA